MDPEHETPPAPAPGAAPPGPSSRSGPVVVAVVFALLAGGAAFTAGRVLGPRGTASHPESREEAPLPVYDVVPPFSFTERGGETVTLESLRGRIWVVDFIFTRCAGICPEMSTRMTAVHEAFRRDPDALCVSITVDPERDTPEVLREYAERYGASEDRWLYLRGPVEEVLALSHGGLHIGDAEDPLIHSQRFVLVDRQGRIRGYYRGTEAAEVDRLLADYRRIRDEGP